MHDPFGRARKVFALPAAGPRHPEHPGWRESTREVLLADATPVRLRPLLSSDGEHWRHYRLLDEAWLRPVEPTVWNSWEEAHTKAAWESSFNNLRARAQAGDVVPLVIEVAGEFAGQVTIGTIQHGRVSEAWIGYWVYSGFQGRGVATAACALGTDHAFARIGLHRVTATFLPANPASGRVLAKCGFREEGFLRRNLHIDGRWQDHVLMAQNVDDFSDTCVARLKRAGLLR